MIGKDLKWHDTSRFCAIASAARRSNIGAGGAVPPANADSRDGDTSAVPPRRAVPGNGPNASPEFHPAHYYEDRPAGGEVALFFVSVILLAASSLYSFWYWLESGGI